MFRLGGRAPRPIDQLRPGLLQLILQRLRTLNENTRRLVRLLEDADLGDLGTRVVRTVRDRIGR